jgi:hypothetical protein
MVSSCHHTLWRLVLLLGDWIDASRPEQRLFLFLDKTTAWAAPSSQAVHEARTFDAVLFAIAVSLDSLEDRLSAAVGSAVPGTALEVLVIVPSPRECCIYLPSFPSRWSWGHLGYGLVSCRRGCMGTNMRGS